MSEKEFLTMLHADVHGFMGSKIHLILEDNNIPPKVDLDDAMDFITGVCKALEKRLKGDLNDHNN